MREIIFKALPNGTAHIFFRQSQVFGSSELKSLNNERLSDSSATPP